MSHLYLNKGQNMKDIIGTMTEAFRKEDLNVLYVQIREGEEIAGEYYRLPQKARLNMYSVSKSVVSVGAGIAIGEGLIDVEEKIGDSFTEYIRPDVSPNAADIKVKHLLTMTSGLSDPLFFADSPERYCVKDWVDYFFHAEFGYRPGTHFLYSNFNTYILSCLIEKKAGQNLLEYLRYRLFEPIGIGNPDWTLCPKGHVHAANGLFLNIDELGNFGEMLLNYGVYKGQRIVSENYLREATVDHVTKRAKGTQNGDFFGYGYQFWMTPIENTFMCNGNYGQYCLIMPEKNVAISVISFEKNYERIKDILLANAAEL